MKLITPIRQIWKTITGSKEQENKNKSELSKLKEQLELNYMQKTSNATIEEKQTEKISGSEILVDEEASKKSKQDEKQKIINELIVRSELNLEQNSVFTVSTYRKKSRTIKRKIETSEGTVDLQVVIGKTVDGIEVGVLNIHHFKLYLTLLELWENSGKPINDPVHFTILNILNRLGLSDAGSNYNMIKRHLMNLRQIPLTFTDSFYTNDTGYNSLRPFSVLSYLDIYERTYNTKSRGKTTRGYGEFKFDGHILESLLNNYSHPLRLDVITQFKKHKDLTILLYTYLDRNLAFKNVYEVGLEKLFDHLDLSQGYIKYPSERKKKLVPVIKQIEGKPLSTGKISYCRIHKTENNKDYKLVCRKSSSSRKVLEKQGLLSEPEKDVEDIENTLLKSLTNKGLTDKQAEKLLLDKGEQVIKFQLECLPFRLKEYSSQGKEINEPAILYGSIKDEWKAPSGYLELEKQKAREAKVQVLKEEFAERIEKAKVEAEIWDAKPAEERIAGPLGFWLEGQRKFGQQEPTEEEIEIKKQELIANLPTKEEYEEDLILQIKQEFHSKEQKIR